MAVLPPPPPVVDDSDILSRSLDQEREALKARQRKKKDTAAAVEQMKSRLRAMGLYKEKDKNKAVKGASSQPPPVWTRASIKRPSGS